MKLLSSPLFWLFVGVLMSVGAWIVVMLARRVDSGSGADQSIADHDELGFRDYVKNPELWRELEESHVQVEDHIDAADEWTEEQVAAAVRRYVLDSAPSRSSWTEKQALRSLGSRTFPTLLQILRTPSLREQLTKLTTRNGEGVSAETPFNRVCDLLVDDPPTEASALLAPYLEDSSDEIRKSAALVIGSSGAESAVASIEKALRDNDEYVRSYALMGLERAIEGERLSDVCRRQLFATVRQLLVEGKNGDEAASILLQFDKQRATEFFLSDAVFTPSSPILDDALRAFNEMGLVIPREKLLALIEQLSADQLQFPRTYQLKEALQSLGRHQAEEDRTILDKYLSHDEKVVARGAAEGMLSSHGLGGFRERIWQLVGEQGETALSDPQRLYLAVTILDGEVNNGGLSQYFFNSSGDMWKEALMGLEAMKSSERLEVLREAVAKFPKGTPAENRETRMQQLAEIAQINDSDFEELDSRYYKSGEVVEVMAMRYVLKNPEAFK